MTEERKFVIIDGDEMYSLVGNVLQAEAYTRKLLEGRDLHLDLAESVTAPLNEEALKVFIRGVEYDKRPRNRAERRAAKKGR